MIHPLYFFIQIILSTLLGAALGWQREYIGKVAGIRTFAMVSLGSTMFTLISIYGFNAADSPHVAGQILPGIGFIGAGTIIHKRGSVEGLTTAAGLWMTAAIGMTVGMGYYFLASATTFLALLVLMLDEHHFRLVDHLPENTSKK